VSENSCSGREKFALPEDRRRSLATAEGNVEASLAVQAIYTAKRRSIQIQEPHGSIKTVYGLLGAEAIVRLLINGKALELFDDLWRVAFDLSVGINQVGVDVGQDRVTRLECKVQGGSSSKRFKVPLELNVGYQLDQLRNQPTLSARPLEKRFHWGWRARIGHATCSRVFMTSNRNSFSINLSFSPDVPLSAGSKPCIILLKFCQVVPRENLLLRGMHDYFSHFV
jgi:hypothetical protein